MDLVLVTHGKEEWASVALAPGFQNPQEMVGLLFAHLRRWWGSGWFWVFLGRLKLAGKKLEVLHSTFRPS